MPAPTTFTERKFAALSFSWEGTSGDAPYAIPHYSTTGHDDPACPVIHLDGGGSMAPVILAGHPHLRDHSFAEWFAESDGFDGEIAVDPPMPCTRCASRGNLPAEARQLARLKQLFAVRRGDAAAEALRTTALDMWRAGTLTSDLADQFIHAAAAVPAVTPPAPSNRPRQQHPSLHLDEGHYAVELDGRLRFFSVDEGKGRWAGRLFIGEVIGGQGGASSVTRQVAIAVRKAIHGDTYHRPANEELGIEAGTFIGPDGCALRYADEIGRCVQCNRRLTDKVSRQTGLGPDCGGRR